MLLEIVVEPKVQKITTNSELVGETKSAEKLTQ